MDVAGGGGKAAVTGLERLTEAGSKESSLWSFDSKGA